MREERTVCDRCGAAKGTANRWWAIWRHVDYRLSIATRATPDDLKAALWSKDICSQACVQAEVDDFLSQTK